MITTLGFRSPREIAESRHATKSVHQPAADSLRTARWSAERPPRPCAAGNPPRSRVGGNPPQAGAEGNLLRSLAGGNPPRSRVGGGPLQYLAAGAITLLAVLGAAPLRAEEAPADAAGPQIVCFPPDIRLDHGLDYQSFIVMAIRADGVTQDVTEAAEKQIADPAVASLEGNRVLPAGDGQTALHVRYADKEVEISVSVQNTAAKPPVSFILDVMPLFSRAGCNTGSCHGAARGKDGFRLSLFGYDPAGDHFRITRELPFRRVNLAIPEESLLVQKAVGAVPHTGGKRFEIDSESYRVLIAWLQAGAPYDGDQAAHVVDLEVFPPSSVLEGTGAEQRLVARAKYSDGTDRDVTNWVTFISNNDNSATVTPDGRVTAGKRGEAFVLARFEGKTVASQVLVLPADLPYAPPAEQPANYIDELVLAKLATLRITPSPICDDATFLRRVTLDIAGRLPTEEEWREFAADGSADKRSRVIDRLLEQKEFAEIWGMKWAELLMIRSSNTVSVKSAFLYNQWLTEGIAKNTPVNVLFREMLAASGGTFRNPATNFYQVETDTLKTTENVAQLFMGVRIQCAQCHNHPFDRWTMDDYYSFAAFFAQIGRKTGEDYRETIVFNRGNGEIRHPVDNRVMKPKFLGGDEPDTAGKDRRELLAEWITSPENPFFAVNLANRIWAHFFGIGIVEPVDDVRVSNPPSNPQLYEALGRKLVEYDFDFKRLVRDICNSNTYQRSLESNPSNADDTRNFARAIPRRIQAEILLDCINQVTESQEKFRGLPLGARAVQIADGATSNYFLTTFGRSSRESVCACDVKTSPTLSQALHLINGQTVETKIRQGGLIARLLESGKSPEEVVSSLYIRAFSREPTAEEMARLAEILAAAPNPRQGLGDIFWAVLNSREFVFNH